jgi:hypothetical protein
MIWKIFWAAHKRSWASSRQVLAGLQDWIGIAQKIDSKEKEMLYVVFIESHQKTTKKPCLEGSGLSLYPLQQRSDFWSPFFADDTSSFLRKALNMLWSQGFLTWFTCCPEVCRVLQANVLSERFGSNNSQCGRFSIYFLDHVDLKLNFNQKVKMLRITKERSLDYSLLHHSMCNKTQSLEATPFWSC